MKNILKNHKKILMVALCCFMMLVLPQQVAAKGTVADIISVARAQVGVSGTPNKYTKAMGMIGNTYSYAWCHAFVSWCAKEAGAADKIPWTASCRTGVTWFKNKNQWKERSSGYIPKAGDIIYFDYSADGTYDHVGIVTGAGNGRVYTIEGNARNAVKINGGYSDGYSLSSRDIIGYGTPTYRVNGHNPKGCLDIVSGGTSTVRVRGWAIDDDVPTKSINLHVYVGEPGASGTQFFAISANKERIDVGKQYPGTGNYHGFDETLTVSTSGTKKVYVYAINEGGGSDHTLLGTKTITINPDTQRPTVSDAKIFGENADGYMLYCTVKDNVQISSVKVATWTNRNGQDDLKWVDMAEVEPGVMKLFIPFSDHNNEYDVYHNHIYAKDSSNNEVAVAVLFDRVNLVLSEAKRVNLGTGFYATITNEGRGKAITGASSGAIVSCTNTKANNQKWKFERNSDGSYSMQLRSNGKYLDNAFAAGTSNSRLMQCERNQTTAQKWNIYSTDNGSYYLRPLCSDDCVMDLLDYSNEENAQVAIHILNTSVAQRFRITKVTIGVESISLNRSSLAMTAKNQTYTLSAVILPADAANKSVSWSSSNSNVATVDSKGKVTAVGNGTATITAKTGDGNKTATCKVTVNIPIPVTSVSLNPTELTMIGTGTTKRLTATINPVDASNKTVSWTSSNSDVVTVNQNGVVTAKGGGTAQITVKTLDGGKTAKCTVHVNIPATGIRLSTGTVNLTADMRSFTVTASITPSNATNQKIIWSSDDDKIATVTDGKIVGVSSGVTTIRACLENGQLEAICEVRVDFTEDRYSGRCGENVFYQFTPEKWTLTIFGAGPMADFIAEDDVPWSQYWSDIRKVILTPGVTHIGNYTFANLPRLESVQISEGVKSIGKSAFAYDRLLQQIELPESLITIGESVFSFTSIDDIIIPRNVTNLGSHSLLGIDTIYGYTGSVAEKYAEANGSKFESLDLIPVKSIHLEQSELTFTKKGQTQKLVYMILPDNATEQAVHWESDNPQVAVVDKQGNVTAVGNGATLITVIAADGSISASCEVRVNVPETCTHVWGTYEVDQNPACETAGLESVYCIRCKAIKPGSTRSIPVLGHEKSSAGNARAATKTAEGYTGDVICVRCGTLLKEGQLIPKLDNPVLQNDVITPLKAGDRFEFKNLQYQILEENYVKVTGMQTVHMTELLIPDVISYQGRTYRVTEIAAKAFRGDKYLTSVSVGNNVVKIGKCAFGDCDSLKTIILGKKVQKIGSEAFGNCNHLKKVVIKTKELKAKSLGKHVFRGCKKLTVKLPKKKFASYKQLLNRQGISAESKFIKLK